MTRCWGCGHKAHKNRACTVKGCVCHLPGDMAQNAAKADKVAIAMLARLPIVIDYLPGNYTRYEIAFLPLAAASFHADDQIHSKPDQVVVALLNFGSAYPFKLVGRENPTLHWTYIAEKLRLNEGDAKAIEHLLAQVIERMAP